MSYTENTITLISHKGYAAMFNSRDVVIFLAGAFFLFTVTHVIFPYVIALPAGFNLVMFTRDISLIMTPTVNIIIVSISAVITVGLLIWSYRLKH